ncbi:putative membrane protein [Paenibacillus wynnii]|nr:putative membrane protein [Paenibacillus wynnii]
MNQKYIKGITFIILEILVDVQANFNTVIILSFHGQIHKAIEQTNYQYLMFYPCLYFFAIWDAFRDAGGGGKPLLFFLL